MLAKFFLVGIAALAHASSAFEIRQVSFNDLNDPALDSDARDAKIYEVGENGSHCFVYTSQANYDLPSTYSFDDFKIWETCGVFDGDGPMANELLRGDDTGSGTKYTFADTSGDGSKTCYIVDAPPTGNSAELLSRPSGSITVLQDTKLSEGKRSSRRCDLSRDGTVVVFDTDDASLTNDDRADGQEHVVYTQDEGNSFIRVVPDEFYSATDKKESISGVVSGDGSFVAFHSNIGYPGASLTASETYLWRESDKNIHKVTNLKGNECNKTLMFETLVDLYGIEKLTEQTLATESKLGNAAKQCNAFAAAGELSQTGTIDVKDNPASISDDGRFVTFTTNYDSATLRGTLEKPTPVSQRHLFLFDSKLGITWQLTDEGESVGGMPVDEPKLEKFGCPRTSKSYGGGAVTANRTACSERNQIRQACCWQSPLFFPVVTQRISGNGESIVYSSDLGPITDTGIQMDYEIVHYHLPTGTRTQITDTGNRDYKDFFPSISRMGGVVAWTSRFDYTTNKPITTTNQIFASKLIMGCSRDTTASNFEASPDVEVCCEFDTLNLDNNSNTAAGEGTEVTFVLMGDPDTLKAHVAFSDVDSDLDKKWCAAYVEQVRNDVACSLAVPKESFVIDDDASDCNNWTQDQIEVTLLLLNENPIKDVSDICTEIQLQYDDTNSKLWTSYLTKTLKLENTPICTSAAPSVKPSASPSNSPSVSPSANPSAAPSANPSAAPSGSPSAAPSGSPSTAPSATPSAAPSATPSAAPSATPNAAPSATPSTTPIAEVTCENNSTVKFQIFRSNGKKKNTKCNKIKEKDCDTTFQFKKMVDGVSEGKPQDFCQYTCNLLLCWGSRK